MTAMFEKIKLIIRLDKAMIVCWPVFMIFTACGYHPKDVISTAKAVPHNYINIANNRLHCHQDTLYLQHQQFTGYLYSLYANGDTEYVTPYFNGLQEGGQQNWYPNRQLAEKRLYIAGKKQGVQQGWWPDGKQRFAYTAVNDAYNGELKEWNSKGMLYLDLHYINGQEEGSERLWWNNGTIRANYVVRNGKRYGLLGMKVCANPYDSVFVKRKSPSPSRTEHRGGVNKQS
jgi:hypothetical protein